MRDLTHGKQSLANPELAHNAGIPVKALIVNL